MTKDIHFSVIIYFAQAHMVHCQKVCVSEMSCSFSSHPTPCFVFSVGFRIFGFRYLLRYDLLLQCNKQGLPIRDVIWKRMTEGKERGSPIPVNRGPLEPADMVTAITKGIFSVSPPGTGVWENEYWRCETNRLFCGRTFLLRAVCAFIGEVSSSVFSTETALTTKQTQIRFFVGYQKLNDFVNRGLPRMKFRM